MRPAPSLRPLLALAVAAALLAGCGDDASSPATSSATPTATGTRPPGTTAAPCAGDGCDTTTSTSAPDPAAPSTTTGPSTTAGPTTTAPPATLAPTATPSASVLPGTVTVTGEGGWRARGFVQSNVGSPLAGIVVVADLVDGSGAVIGSGQVTSPVYPVAPGQIVPFDLQVDVPLPSVAEARWRTAALAGDVPAVAAQTQVFWTRAAADARPVDFPLYRDPPGAPHAHLVFGSAIATSATPAPAVVGAWVNPAGQVLAVASSPVYQPGTDRPAPSIEAGGSGDFLLVVDGPAAAGLDTAELQLWPSLRL